jgi:hypothetical protein
MKQTNLLLSKRSASCYWNLYQDNEQGSDGTEWDVPGFLHEALGDKLQFASVFSQADYLMTLSVHDQMINECGALGGIRIGRETEVLERRPPQCHFTHHKSHMTWSGNESEPAAANYLSDVTIRLGVDWVQFVYWFVKRRFKNCIV